MEKHIDRPHNSSADNPLTIISIGSSQVRGPVPALPGVYLGDSPQPFVEEDVARLKEEGQE